MEYNEQTSGSGASWLEKINEMNRSGDVDRNLLEPIIKSNGSIDLEGIDLHSLAVKIFTALMKREINPDDDIGVGSDIVQNTGGDSNVNTISLSDLAVFPHIL